MTNAGKSITVICENDSFRLVIDGETVGVCPRTTMRRKNLATDWLPGCGVSSRMRPVRSHPLFLAPALMATMTCVSLAGCTGPSATHPAAHSPSLPPASRPQPTARPGSPGNPLQLSCGEESFTSPPVPQQPQPGDLAIGPLFIVNGKRLATASPAGYGDHGSYKIPIIVAMGSTVTVIIAAPARGQVMIDNPYAHLRGVSDLAAATYRSCSHIAGFFAQGFTFTHGQTCGCVPLDVRIGHQPQVRHVMLSLFAGSCVSPERAHGRCLTGGRCTLLRRGEGSGRAHGDDKAAPLRVGEHQSWAARVLAVTHRDNPRQVGSDFDAVAS